MVSKQSESKFEKATLDYLDRMLRELQNLNESIRFSLFLDREKFLQYALKVIGKSKKRAEVYLATNGSSTAIEIAKQLDMKRPNVSIEHKILAAAALIKPHKKTGTGYFYEKSPLFESLGLGQIVKKKYILSDES